MKKIVLSAIILVTIIISQKKSISQNISNPAAEPAYLKNAVKTVKAIATKWTVENWKGVTWGSSWKTWGSGPFNTDGVNSDIADIQDAGIHWVRLAFKVGNNPAITDLKIDAAVRAGVSILLRYTKGAPDHSYGTEAEEAVNEAFLKTTVARYKDRVKYWEIHNEPNLQAEWDLGNRVGEGSLDPNSPYNAGVRKYVQHLERSYNAIKSVDPTAVVVPGATVTWHSEAFMNRLNIEGAYKFFDELNVHPYDFTPAGVLVKLNSFKAEVNAWPAPYKYKPIWITEIGFHTEKGWINKDGSMLAGYVGGANEEPKEAKEARKALYLTQTMNLLLANLSPRRPIFWYSLHGPGSSTGFGLEQKSLTGGKVSAMRLPAHAAYKNISDVVAGSAK